MKTEFERARGGRMISTKWRRLATVVAASAVASIGVAEATPSKDGGRGRIDPRIATILDEEGYEHAQWALLQRDPTGSKVTLDRFGDQLFIPGSVAKVFSVSGPWDTLGGDHRFVTPLRTLGERRGGEIVGDVALVAQGDLTMGGRTKADGSVDFVSLDHTYANDIPGATLTPQDPLAGLDEIAGQVRDAGVTRIRGDVVIDDRLFESFPVLDPTPVPLIINDNLIDLLVTPTSAGTNADLMWRPQVAPYRVTSTVETVPPGAGTSISVDASPDGTQIAVSGTIEEGTQPQLRVSPIEDPNAFGRTALIEALARAGVTVEAPPTGPNPAALLPATYPAADPLATYVSPPFSEYAKLILKVSHNLGANLGICLMAADAGSADCADGFAVLAEFLRRAGVDTDQVQLLDGRGGHPVDRATPEAVAQMLSYWLGTPEATAFRLALPILGVDGSLADACETCSAKGKVFAKTGTVAGLDAVNGRIGLAAQTLAGYIDVGGGQYDVIFVGVNGAWAEDVEGVVDALVDTGEIAAILQENATRSRDGSSSGG
jgi:D-alanyl-D-alanine carboxypeptidase/D-alanyl-D-alanine-endopeptidase (penicillin-binding protein 4)